MKHLKLIVLMCLVAMIAIAAVACGGTETPGTTATTTADGVVTTQAATDETTPAETTTTATTTAVVTTPDTTLGPVPTSFASMKIGETPISDYTIVYATSPYEAYAKDNSKKQYFPVYDFDHETANRLADLIFDLTGVRLNVVQDTQSTEVANEILIGKTNRTVSSSGHFANLLTDDYVVNVVGTKLVIRGGEHGTTWHAIDYLETRFAAKLAKREVNYTFATGFLYKGNHHLTVIGCIGDSITQGEGASDQKLLGYPAQMGRILWKDAIVYNFGDSGSSMRNDLDAYTNTRAYLDAVNAAKTADIFTIMLGTNDTWQDTAPWTDSDTELYNNSCLGIMASLVKKNANLKFVLANCPAYFGTAGNIATPKTRQIQEALVSIVNDAGYPTTFFDTYTATKTLRSHFPDTVHPNDMGHLKMAEAFAAYLQTLITPTTGEAK